MAETDSYEMSEVYGGTITSESGGDIQLDPEQPLTVPGGIQSTETGAAFGPLEISAYPDSIARIGGLDFQKKTGFIEGLFGSGASGGLFASGVLFASDSRTPSEDDPAVSRRDVLRTLGASGVFLGGATAVATAETTELAKAEFSVSENPGGLRIRVFDRIPNVLPPDELYHTYVDGVSYATFSADSSSDYGDVLPTSKGTVTVGPKGTGGGWFAKLLNDKTQVYEGISLSKPPRETDAGEKIMVTQNDIITEHVSRAGSSKTTLKINGVSIPHESENSSSPRGYYGIHNGSLIYRNGDSPPSGETADLVLYADRTTEVFDDIERGLN